MSKKTNPLLPIGAVLVLSALVAVMMVSSEDSGSTTSSEASNSEGGSEDGDIPADTLRTLTAQVAEFQRTVTNLQTQVQSRDQKISGLQRELSLVSNQAHRPQVGPDRKLIVEDVLSRLQSDLSNPLAENLLGPPKEVWQVSDTLLGQKPEPLPVGNAQPNEAPPQAPRKTLEGRYVRHWPTVDNAQEVADPVLVNPQSADPRVSDLDRILGTTDTRGPRTNNAQFGDRKSGLIPYATIPPDATLIGATSLTALIGRVPKNDQVVDPIKFKLVLGQENLAANGFLIPGLQGMVLSGRAIGDATFSCTRGFITSALFVFDDGTISSTRIDGASQSSGSGSGLSNNTLGYLSDPYGNPCLPGKYVTNAPKNLFLSAGAQGLAGVAAGAAELQTTTTRAGGTNSSSTQVDGNPFAFLAGRAGSNAFQEISRQVSEYQSDQWDAVYLPAGQSVVVHIEEMLEIDRNPQGRRLWYGNQHHTLELD